MVPYLVTKSSVWVDAIVDAEGRVRLRRLRELVVRGDVRFVEQPDVGREVDFALKLSPSGP